MIDRHDVLFWGVIMILVTLAAVFIALIPNEAFTSAYGIQVLSYSLLLSVIGCAILVVYYFWWPSLRLEPLPHYRGYSVPSMDEVKAIQAGYRNFPSGGARKGPIGTEVSHPDAKLLKPSQSMAKYEFNLENMAVSNAFIAKFSVIRVYSLSGTIKNCKAEVRYRILEEAGKTINEDWINGGSLNWYSTELSGKILASEIDERERMFGINKRLFKSEQTITKGDPKDLLVFYMIEHVPNVYLCSSMESAPLGWTEKGPVKFAIRLTVTGEGSRRSIWNYRASAIWDDFKLDKV